MAIDASEWLASHLIASVKRRALIPTADETYNDDDYLSMADEETRLYCVPLLHKLHEEYLVRLYDFSTASGTSSYALPPRCAAESVKSVLVSDGSGEYVPLNRIAPEESKAQSGFYLEDDQIVITPQPTSVVAMRLRYFMRPNRLVLEDTVLIIAGFNGARTTLTCTVPTDETAASLGFASGGSVDLIASSPGFRTRQLDDALGAVNDVSTSVATANIGTAAASSVVVGDFVCLAGTTPVPQLPADMHPILAQRVAVKLLEGTNDVGYDKAMVELEKMEQRFSSLFTNRTEANPQPLQNYNAPGWWGRWRRQVFP